MSFPRLPAPCETEGRGMTVAVVCLVLLVLLFGGALAFLLWRYSRITKGKSHFRLRCLLWREVGEGGGGCNGYKMKNPPTWGLTHMRHDRSRVCALTKQLSRSARACSWFCQLAFDLNWGTWFLFRRRRLSNRGERLHEHLDDSIWKEKSRKEEVRDASCVPEQETTTRKPPLVWAAWPYTLHRNNVKSEPLAGQKNKHLPNGYSAARASKVFTLPHACQAAPDPV